MSTTPTTSDTESDGKLQNNSPRSSGIIMENPFPATYTVIGGPAVAQDKQMRDFSIILLNRGGSMNRAEVLEDLEKLHPDEIISIENPGNTWGIESLAVRFPRVRFILLQQQTNPGQCINIGMQEASGRFAAVFWNDMKVMPAGFSESALKSLQDNPVLCSAPLFQGQKNESLPVLQVPAFQKKKLRILSVLPTKENSPDLFPYDYCGIYLRESFLSLGGYDSRIQNPYWQKTDFGFRSCLWGEKIVLNRAFRVTASETSPAENTGIDSGYRMFFLKNLAVRFTGTECELPSAIFFSFFFHSRCGFFTALTEFRLAGKWVSRNAQRFKMDSRSIAEQWEDPSE